MLIQSLNQTWLENIIQSLNMVFHSEAHFQFCLAWEIKKHFNCNVILEDYTACVKDPNGKIIQKLYTDIVVEDTKSNYRIGIEVKYKTAELTYNNVHLFNHGALPLGRYDYLWDINRLESIIYNKPLFINSNKCTMNFKTFNVAYAIILTNDRKYWEKSQFCYLTNIDSAFRIHDGNNLTGLLNWNSQSAQSPKIVVDTRRAHSIDLRGNYTCHWKPYLSLNIPKGEFRLMITEIHKKKNNLSKT